MPNITGTANNDIFQGTVDNDVIQGLAGNDSIKGNGGDDTIDAGLGYDTVDGGQSRSLWQGSYDEDNLLIVDYSSNTYTGSYSGITSNSSRFNLSEGYFSAYYDSNYGADVVNFTNIKRFQITGTAANDNIVTGSGNDTIASGDGDDIITSGNGDDIITSGNGDDTISGFSTLYISTLYSSNEINTIDAGAGIDTLVDGDFVTATTALSFSDTISHSSPIVLTDGTNVSNVEKFTNVTTGSGNDTISYSQRNQNKFSTGSGDDTINAGLGADTVDGGTDPNTGADNDLLIVDYSSNTYTGTDSGTYSSVYSNGQGEFEGFFTAAFSNGQADILHFSNINRFQVTATGANDNIYTGDGNDTIVGGAGNDSINSFAGNDSIDGGAGNDTIVGGDGNDSYIVDSIGDVVNETSTLTTEIDNVQSSVTYGLGANLENLTLTGTSRINGTGNSLNNTITGNSAANGISGGAGDDTMTGGAGNDVYIVDSVGDVISETSVLTTEIDTVWSGVSYTLGANVERLTLIGTSAINGTGNSLNNTVTGNSANNTLFGGIGNDILIGASGNDSLTGGDGSDRFIYDTNVAFTSSAIGIDQITDFVSGTDKIVLDKTTFTALTSITGNGFNLASEFAVVGTDAAASTSSALIVYSSETDNLFYNQNGVTSGLGSGAQLATLSGITTLSASDFELQA